MAANHQILSNWLKRTTRPPAFEGWQPAARRAFSVGPRKDYSTTTQPFQDAPDESSPTMEFTALFLAVTIVMIAAWRGPRTLALALFAVTLVACVATYLHHASTVLKLSF
jgi:hypothetical protein